MRVLRGIAVARGVAFGPALVLGTEDFRIPQRFVRVDVVETEIARFRTAFQTVCGELSENQQLAAGQLGEQYGAIFAAHLQLLQDPRLSHEIESLVREKCYSPEFAVSRVLRHYAKLFQGLGGNYLAERAADIFDLEKRILGRLLGSKREELRNLTEPVLVLAHNLTPSETANLDRNLVRGFATEVGGHTSHTAILAGALGIPAVIGIGHFLADVSGGEQIIIDGNQGEVIIDPDEETLARYKDSEVRFRLFAQRLQALRPLTAETRDGVRIKLLGNIEFPEEARLCVKEGAEGIGLYRTEFLYLDQNRAPTEEEHYDAYRRVLEAFPQQPVVIRTMDLGADKLPQALQHGDASHNTMFGLRSLRLCLRNLPMFKTQLRAILRAAVHGDIRIMFPLVSTLLEMRQARWILNEVIDDLEEAEVPFRRDIPVGMMVEVPSAALLADEFAQVVDFFSVGTNDLIQYTLAVDRADQSAANLFTAADPSILRLLRMVITAANRRHIGVSVCGQMSSDPVYTALLIGLGLRQLSVGPQAVSEVKEVIRNLTIEQAEDVARHAEMFDAAREVETYLRGELRRFREEPDVD